MLSQKTKISSKACSQSSNNIFFITEESTILPKLASFLQNSHQNTSFKSTNSQSSQTRTFSQKYSIISQIGKGSFGKIYKVFSKSNISKVYAAKIVSVPRGQNYSDLEKEAKIISSLSCEEGFPKIKSFHRENDVEILLMSLLGQNLKTLQSRCGGKFSLKTISLLALQILRRIEVFHSKGLLHRDLKPENFVMGSKQNQETVYLIDFGLSESFLDSQGKHVNFDTNQIFAGTLYFVSPLGHLGVTTARRDDLISIGYMLVHFFKGALPWAQLQGDRHEVIKKMFQIKSTIKYDNLCSGLPQEFSEYMNYVLNLSFNQNPDYEFMLGLFKKVLDDLGDTEDGHFEWVETEGFHLKGPNVNGEGLKRYIKDLEESDIEWDL